jgi:5'-nucleotidase
MREAGHVFILLTNDDGVEAPGLHALAAALATMPATRLAVVAPMANRTGAGTSVSFGPLTVLEHPPIAGAPAWSVDGTPLDAAGVGLQGIFGDDPPDLVISGVNQGLNLGRIAIHSGTVGAALRASLLGYTALAVSSQTDRDPTVAEFAEAAHLARRLLEAWIAGDLRLPLDGNHGHVLSLNVPRGYNGRVRWTRQGWRYFRLEQYRRDQDGVTYHPVLEIDSLEPHAPEALAEPEDTDVGALARGYATLTPLHPLLFSGEAYARLPAALDIDLAPLYPLPAAADDVPTLPPGAETER